MSQKGKEAAQTPPPLETVEHVSANVKGQKKLLLALTAISAISLSGAVFAIVMSMGGAEHEPSETAASGPDTLPQFEARLDDVSGQVEAMQALTQRTRVDLDTLSTQVASIDVNDERNVIIRLQRLLIKQEQDFQAFIGSLESGMYNFHMMVPHSRGWWDEYQVELKAVTQKSEARENYATTLRDN